MSELVPNRQQQNFRWHLLASVSALAIAAGFVAAPAASADDQNHFSIELGGQYGIESGGSTDWFALPAAGGEGFYSNVNSDEFRLRPKHSWNIDGAVKFQPADTDLIFKVGVQFGRTARVHGDTHFTYATSTDGGTYYQVTARGSHKEEHAKVDFQVGKDFGLGMFGNNGGTSIFSVGIRYAQFNSRTDINLNFTTETKYATGSGSGAITRRFTGVGPMISWEASAPISDNGFGLDWGAEAAVLFGRQSIHFAIPYYDGYTGGPVGGHRSKTVPEVGGFMGLSYTCPDAPAKFTLGYKVDALFNVYEAGLLTGRDADRITHGPFAKIGISFN